MARRKTCLLIACCFVTQFLLGQTVFENNPAGLRWYKVKTPNFNVLFPEGFDAQAQRMANTLEHIRLAESNSMGRAPRKINVILQNQSSISNGFVSMFPRRSEFFTMPPQNYNFVSTNDWLNMLAAHEYRHIVQYRHASRGFNKLVFYLFGNPSFAGLAHAAAPDWFWEGDAVATETAFTHGGRGRIPHFALAFRTNLLEGRTFNYHKQYLRSYKHHIPNHYVLGFHMVSYLRRRTNDPDIWEKITARSWSVPFVPFAFSNAIKNKAGLHVTNLYKQMAAELTWEWKAQLDTLNFTPFERINQRTSSTYTDYLYPQPQPDGSVVVRKEGIGDIEQYVSIRDKEERKIFTPGFINDAGMLSAQEGVILWNEFGYDPRWRMRSYSVIKAYDSHQKKMVRVSDKKTRLGSAAISPDKRFIVTIRSDNAYRHSVVIMSYPEGNILKVFPNPENYFWSMPRWSDDGQAIVVLKTTPKGKAITVLNVRSGEAEDILPESDENVGAPLLYKDFLFFNSPVGGIDNIHAVDLRTRHRYQVTTSRYGAYNPAPSADGSFIYYNDQSRDGMDVVRISFDPTQWKEYVPDREGRTLYDHLVEQEGRPHLFDSIPQNAYPVGKYSRWNVINPFSWGLFVENDLATVDVGITSRDILSTMQINAGYSYDINEGTGLWRVGASYQGFYPIIDVDYTQGKRSVNEGAAVTTIIRGSDTTSVVRDMVFDWEEQNVSVGLRIPWVFSKSRFSSGVTVSNRIGYTRVRNLENEFLNDRFYPTLIRNDTIFQGYRFLNYVGNGELIYNHFSVSASRFLKRSRRDIVSRWGQSIRAQVYHTAFSSDFTGGLASVTGNLYFPGLMKHHGLYGQASVQRIFSTTNDADASDVYYFRNTVPLPRGHSLSRFQTLYTFSANYTFPLWYPDIAIGPLLNLQRFRVNAFTDYAFGEFSFFRGANQSYWSVGGELFVDFNIFRFMPQFDLGVRYSYGITPSVSNIELVIGTFNF